jgi:hypothetical protein
LSFWPSSVWFAPMILPSIAHQRSAIRRRMAEVSD